MEKLTSRLLRHSLLRIRNFMMSNQTLRNAMLDVSNTSEFSDLHEHEKMLSDQTRVNTYQRAIAKHIKPGETVIDLGTGSGILSFFAATCNPAKVYAIDHSDFITVAKKLARNKPEFNIQFEKVNSRSFQPDEKVDVILHEQIGDELFEENMIENIMDLKERVLKKGGRILPGKFELYLEPFSLKPEFRIPYFWENKFCDIDFSILKNSRLLDKFKPHTYQHKYVEPFSIDFYLCKNEPVLTFDLNDENFSSNFSIPRQHKIVENSGLMDGVCIYFNVIFDDEISFDTSPLNKKSSWGNRFFRTEKRFFKEGESIVFDVKMQSYQRPDTWQLIFPDQAYVQNDAVASVKNHNTVGFPAAMRGTY